ncbi:universal stress protein [Ilumatobacter sp.]|uniref:universal stress protein n=1 Tax=Ilumatobacter sp. TaxID=1967498 RepID=UPI003C317D72
MQVTHKPGATESTRRWIVGADGSECAGHAAAWAARHVRGRAEALRVITAWNIPSVASVSTMGAGVPAWDTREISDAAAAIAQDVARSVCTELGSGDDGAAPSRQTTIQVGGSACQGDASSVLLEASRESSLLVVGARGRGGFSRLILGSTSTQCTTHAIRPTAVIPAAAAVGTTRRIVVAFDGSENSRAALDWAMAFAGGDCVIECVMVWDVTPIVVGADQFFFPEASDLARERFGHLVDQAEAADAQRRLTDRPQIERTFVDGHPRRELARVSEGADLIVMGARGHGAIGSAILGSVSTWLLHHVDRPIVVVPHHDHVGSHESGTAAPH